MSRQPNGRSGPRPRGRPPSSEGPLLDRKRILEAALDLVDSEGSEALSMRRLARALAVAPNALYSYVEDKDDLFRGVVEIALGSGALQGSRAGDWRERARESCRWFRRRLLEHPNLVVAPGFRQSFAVANLPFASDLGRALRDCFDDPHELVTATFALFYHTAGFVLMEVARGRTGLPTQGAAFLEDWGEVGLGREDERERMREIAPLVSAIDLGAAFELSLEAMLDGLEARARRKE